MFWHTFLQQHEMLDMCVLNDFVLAGIGAVVHKTRSAHVLCAFLLL